MKRWVLLLAMFFSMTALVGCGGGGGGGGSSPTSMELPGTYRMTGMRITIDGTTYTDDELGEWSGSLDMGTEEMRVVLNVDGETIFNDSSWMEATWTHDGGGTIYDGYDTIDFTMSGLDLTLIWYDWTMDGSAVDMYLYYEKTSDDHSSASVEPRPKAEGAAAGEGGVLGGLGTLVKSLTR